jgi:type II secretion system (T2SS) protein M
VTLTSRDKRALIGLGVVGGLMIVYAIVSSSGDVVAVATPATPEIAEKRLARARQLAAIAPHRDEILRQVSRELADREKGLLQADTAAQAQAQLLQIMRRLLKAQAPPVELKSVEIGQPRPFGEDYGEVSVGIVFDCRIEQLVNLLSDITAQPEVIATSELRIGQAAAKEKLLPVRLIVTGLVERRLIPQKKGLSAF